MLPREAPDRAEPIEELDVEVPSYAFTESKFDSRSKLEKPVEQVSDEPQFALFWYCPDVKDLPLLNVCVPEHDA